MIKECDLFFTEEEREFPIREKIVILPADDPNKNYKWKYPRFLKGKYLFSFRINILKLWYKYILREECKMGWEISEVEGIVPIYIKRVEELSKENYIDN